MEDCGNPQCLHERRLFKRELLSWYKKVPYVIGLELVTENLAGNSSGHIKTLLLPFNDMEPDEATDFEAQDLCTFCDGKKCGSMDDTEDAADVASPPKSSPSCAQTSSIALASDSSHIYSMASLAALSAERSSDMEGLSSFYNQLAMTSFLYQQQHQHQQLQSAVAAAQVAATSNQLLTSKTASLIDSSAVDSPLDLSPATDQLSLHVDGPSLRVPEVRPRKKLKENILKKAYSDHELNAAVEAIKSGSIGTRKAAQMFGVPRSTLRNKVFKSSDMSKQLLDNHQQLEFANPTADEENKRTPVGECQPEIKSAARTTIGSTSHSDKEMSERMAQHSTGNFLKQLEEMRLKQNLTEQYGAAANGSLFSDMFTPLQFPGYQFFMPQYPTLTAVPGLEYLNPYNSAMMLPYLPDLMKNLTKKRLELEQMQLSQHFIDSNSKQKPKRKADADDLGLKIPSYRPSTSSSLTEFSNQLADSLNCTAPNAITSPALSSATYLQNLPYQRTSPGNHLLRPDSGLLPSKKMRLESSGLGLGTKASSVDSGMCNGTNGNGSSSSSASGKKRPKRGQYRKYDSELLAQAVRAVQRGEMSVHRAGTFFGVPHSTLEYKVKERHLLRKKKIAENAENKNSPSSSMKPSSTLTSVSASCHSTDSNQSEKTSTTTKEENMQDTDGSSVLKTTPSFLGLQAAYAFPEMTSPASELLKKLQERAQKKAEDIIKKESSPETPPTKYIESVSN